MFKGGLDLRKWNLNLKILFQKILSLELIENDENVKSFNKMFIEIIVEDDEFYVKLSIGIIDCIIYDDCIVKIFGVKWNIFFVQKGQSGINYFKESWIKYEILYWKI